MTTPDPPRATTFPNSSSTSAVPPHADTASDGLPDLPRTDDDDDVHYATFNSVLTARRSSIAR